MTKGAESKTKLFSDIKNLYPDAFWEDEGKILRVPMMEGSNIVEIKVTLTAAKTNMGSGEIKGAFSTTTTTPSVFNMPSETTANLTEITEEEKQNVANLIAALNL